MKKAQQNCKLQLFVKYNPSVELHFCALDVDKNTSNLEKNLNINRAKGLLFLFRPRNLFVNLKFDIFFIPKQSFKSI
jgi:hypothetical protein